MRPEGNNFLEHEFCGLKFNVRNAEETQIDSFTFPLFGCQLHILKRLIIDRRSGLITGIAVFLQVRMRQSLLGCDSLVSIQFEHLFQQVNGQRIGASEDIFEVALLHHLK